ncbi:hypothetical protein K505DRAFT_321650 [Melanomma pulvis-pyrius CBS 109.77]|uniref:Uncharacterized protein n=1 Tax=Melanomma pulvis-pyrius CBS 109.77 TaxID=1314802 RepID=A0A6A6XQB5_9PLEO|nr:hypothetical protein K505DRAFT_321650 [Melanomma pulvis-pyrius CBS 109.77]
MVIVGTIAPPRCPMKLWLLLLCHPRPTSTMRAFLLPRSALIQDLISVPSPPVMTTSHYNHLERARGCNQTKLCRFNLLRRTARMNKYPAAPFEPQSPAKHSLHLVPS